ncbi:MAG: DUF433 domain-containing protein [Bacteroidetes bacterium]|nr:DUF433 domain-containing protein [Bacteroidota bacterium]
MLYGGVHPREYPLYSCQSVSKALRIPYSTLYSWLYSHPDGSLISNLNSDQTLNFLQLSEAFAINYMRKSLEIPLSKIREATDYLRDHLKISYPLIDHRIRVGSEIHFKHAQDILLNATRYGQLESIELGDYINRLEFKDVNLPDVLYPWIKGQKKKRSIKIDPRIRFGQPSITGTGITVEIVHERFEGGESPKDIALGYGIALSGVEDAIAYATH